MKLHSAFYRSYRRPIALVALAVTAIALALMAVAATHGHPLPNPLPLFLLLVAFAAVGGLAIGLGACVLVLGYCLVFYAQAGHPLHYVAANLLQLGAIFLTTHAMALIVGFASDSAGRLALTESVERHAQEMALANRVLSEHQAQLLVQQRELGALNGELLQRNAVMEAEIARRTHELREAIEQLEEAQRLAHIGSYRWQAATQRVHWSAELLRIFGFGPGEFPATFEAYLERVHPDDRPSILVARNHTLATGEPFHYEARITRTDGEERIIDARGVLKGQPGDPERALVGTAQDVTELKRALEAAAGRAAELQRAQEVDRMKGAFVNAVSHELRTPLTSIVGYAEFLEDEIGGPLSEQQREFVRQLGLGAERLKALVDDLLDFARIDAGTFTLREASSDLADKTREVLESLQPQALERRLTLTSDLPAEPVPVRADPVRIGQVLINLINNAIKFSEPGDTITVRLRAGDGFVRFEVQDTGIGIADDDLPKLFKRFSQLDSGDNRKAGGTGLGLSICKAIVEAHGGEIGVTSTLGVGSTFWFTLPNAPGPAGIGSSAATDAPGRSPSR